MAVCLTSERKEKIEHELYSFVLKIPASQVSHNRKYYKLLAIVNPSNQTYKKKFVKYDALLTKEEKRYAQASKGR